MRRALMTTAVVGSLVLGAGVLLGWAVAIIIVGSTVGEGR